MTSDTIAARAQILLDTDAENLRGRVLALTANERPRFVRHLVALLADSARLLSERRKASLVLRELLADAEPVLTDHGAAQVLTTVATLLRDERDSQLLKSLLTLTALLTARVSPREAGPLDALSVAYDLLAQHADAPIAELSSILLRRLKHSQTVFTRRREADAGVVRDRRETFADIDLVKAARNVRADAAKDWLMDPWFWPEIDWLAAEGRAVVEQRLCTNTTGYVVKLDVAKDIRSTRPALVMDPADRLAYQGLIDKVSLELVGNLPSWVYGWRLSRESPEPGQYADNKLEWKRYTADLSDRRRQFRYAAHFDIRGFFASVPLRTLLNQLLRQCRSYRLFERVEEYLYSWNSAASRSGLPQRFLASSLLAQAYLRPLDDYLARATGGSNQDRMATLRWMDDIWLFSNDEPRLQQCSNELASLLEQLGLEFNSDKTVRFSGRWSGKEDWYLSYLGSRLSPNDWSVEAWAEMFPSHTPKPPKKVADAFVERLGASIQTTVVPRSCHLLAAWFPETARSVFPTAVSVSRAFEYRGLAFAGLECGQGQSEVTSWLAAYPETTYLVDLVRAKGFAPFPSRSDHDLPTSLSPTASDPT